MKNVRTFADLKSSLNKRASAAQAASQKKANESGGVPAVPETDDRSKGTVAIPKDPDGAPMKATGLENKTNAEVTGSFAPTASKTITGEEKPASLAGRAQKIAAGVRDLAAQLHKKAEAGTDGGKSVTPNMPPNTQCNDGTTEGGKPKPPSGGAGAKNNPDANAKTAGAPADAAAPAKAAGSSMAAEGTDKEKKVSLPAGDSKGNIPDSKNNTNETKGNGQAAVESKGEAQDDNKMAASSDFQIDASYHLKLASLILSTEEGRMFAQRQIEKAHGAEAAADIVKAASIMEQRAIEIAEMEASGAAEAEAMWKSASAGDRAKIVKLASVHSKGRAQFNTELEKQAYDAGAMAAAQMGDAGMLGGAPAGAGADAGAAGAPAGLDPAAAGGMGGAEAAGGGMGGAEAAGAMGGGGGEELSPDAVVAALDQMVSSGELQPEQAAEILQAILGGGAGGAGGAEAGGAAGGMPPGAAGGMPPGAAGGGMPPGAEAGGAPASPATDKGGAEKKEPAAEKKESPKEEAEEEKEAALLKRAHDLARSAIIPAKK